MWIEEGSGLNTEAPVRKATQDDELPGLSSWLEELEEPLGSRSTFPLLQARLS